MAITLAFGGEAKNTNLIQHKSTSRGWLFNALNKMLPRDSAPGARQGRISSMQKQTTAVEEWRQVVIDGDVWPYEVSNWGRIRRTGQARGARVGQVRKNKLDNRGYYVLTLRRPGEQKTKQVHRLVALAFIPQNGKPEVNHRDGNKLNNHHSNLEWATSAEQKNHALDSGLKRFGEDHPLAKLTLEEAKEICSLKGLVSQKGIAKMFGVHKGTVGHIQRGERWERALARH